YNGPMPATLGYLPPCDNHNPAMIAAFGLATEPEPGVLAIADRAVRGIHITRLAADGMGKARTDTEKITVGSAGGSPIVLTTANDLLGLIVCEGIEDALSAHEATGLGAWAAGSASRLPALAEAVPNFIEYVTVLADDDVDGRRHAGTLVRRLQGRHLEARMVI